MVATKESILPSRFFYFYFQKGPVSVNIKFGYNQIKILSESAIEKHLKKMAEVLKKSSNLSQDF